MNNYILQLTETNTSFVFKTYASDWHGKARNSISLFGIQKMASTMSMTDPKIGVPNPQDPIVIFDYTRSMMITAPQDITLSSLQHIVSTRFPGTNSIDIGVGYQWNAKEFRVDPANMKPGTTLTHGTCFLDITGVDATNIFVNWV